MAAAGPDVGGGGIQPWELAVVSTVAGLVAAVVVVLIVCLVRRRRRGRREGGQVDRRKLKVGKVRLGGGGGGRSKEQQEGGSRQVAKTVSNWRATYPVTVFSWGSHTAYVSEAAEHGWPAFALAYYASPSMPVASSLWHMCTKCALHDGFEPEIVWDMGPGVDYMQQVRFNPGLASRKDSCLHPVQALQAALPLPGPCFVPCTFPQDAYFEVTVLAEGAEYKPGVSYNNTLGYDNEYVKLLKRSSSDLFDDGSVAAVAIEDDLGVSKRSESGAVRKVVSDLGKGDVVGNGHDPGAGGGCNLDYAHHVMAVGLGAANAPPFRLPGTDPGSVGFHSSDGATYLNGPLYVDDSRKCVCKRRIWGAVTNTVGCGFDPRLRKVYFTLNGELVHEVFCKTVDYGGPLFPIVAANYDVTVLINYGQIPFEFVPANSSRASDPSCRTAHSRSEKTGGICEDSGDLFSMGRLDSHWLSELESPNSPDLQHRHVLSETESDLFEIVLDGRT